jgi:hypothetical protein
MGASDVFAKKFPKLPPNRLKFSLPALFHHRGVIKLKQKFEFNGGVRQMGEPLFSGSRQSLTSQKEAKTVNEIHQLYASNQCPSPRETLLSAESFSTTKLNEPISLAPESWAGLLRGHSDVIET